MTGGAQLQLVLAVARELVLDFYLGNHFFFTILVDPIAVIGYFQRMGFEELDNYYWPNHEGKIFCQK
jgi:uncharacterized membrane protein